MGEKETVYHGSSCVTKYWIWNEEHNCIAYGKIKKYEPSDRFTLKGPSTEPKYSSENSEGELK